MRLTLAIAVVLAAVFGADAEAQTVYSAPELRVRSGETLTIDRERLSINVSRWVMEDNSTIKIPSGVCNEEDCAWKIEAGTAHIGSGVRIVANGDHGSNGNSPGRRSANARGRCSPGNRGGPGSNGLPGQRGVDIDINMGLGSFGDLSIDVRGGDGGNGTMGGRGGNGSRGSCSDNCRGGRGGDGGRGGAAGAGGNGGSISVSYWIVSVGPVTEPDARHNLSANTQGGSPGLRGVGGNPGAGGGPSGRCGIWPTYWRRGSDGGGSPGARGSPASKGTDGTITVTPRRAP